MIVARRPGILDLVYPFSSLLSVSLPDGKGLKMNPDV